MKEGRAERRITHNMHYFALCSGAVMESREDTDRKEKTSNETTSMRWGDPAVAAGAAFCRDYVLL